MTNAQYLKEKEKEMEFKASEIDWIVSNLSELLKNCDEIEIMGCYPVAISKAISKFLIDKHRIKSEYKKYIKDAEYLYE